MSIVRYPHRVVQRPKRVHPKWAWFWDERARIVAPLFSGRAWDTESHRFLVADGDATYSVRGEPGFVFDGVGDRLRHPDRSVGTDFSDAAFTFRYYSADDGIIQALGAVLNEFSTTGLQLQIHTSASQANTPGRYWAWFRDPSGTSVSYESVSTTAVSLNKWHTVTFVIRAQTATAGERIRIIHNGVELATNAVVDSTTGAGNALGYDMAFGARNNRDSFDRHMNGRIAMTAMHAPAPSTQQIIQLHRDLSGPFNTDYKSVAGAWPTGDTTPPTLSILQQHG